MWRGFTLPPPVGAAVASAAPWMSRRISGARCPLPYSLPRLQLAQGLKELPGKMGFIANDLVDVERMWQQTGADYRRVLPLCDRRHLVRGHASQAPGKQGHALGQDCLDGAFGREIFADGATMCLPLVAAFARHDRAAAGDAECDRIDRDPRLPRRRLGAASPRRPRPCAVELRDLSRGSGRPVGIASGYLFWDTLWPSPIRGSRDELLGIVIERHNGLLSKALALGAIPPHITTTYLARSSPARPM
jgi:hypothetical protein